jgi:hypothetical protein
MEEVEEFHGEEDECSCDGNCENCSCNKRTVTLDGKTE